MIWELICLENRLKCQGNPKKKPKTILENLKQFLEHSADYGTPQCSWEPLGCFTMLPEVMTNVGSPSPTVYTTGELVVPAGMPCGRSGTDLGEVLQPVGNTLQSFVK